MKVLTPQLERIITDYIHNADFSDLPPALWEDNIIEWLVDSGLIPEQPVDREDNDQLLAFIRKQLKEVYGYEA